jgi:ABC-type lipopolysaccharide export system ATPase subunit
MPDIPEREYALDVLNNLERGKFLLALGEELKSLAEAVRCSGRNGASGTLTVTLKMALVDADSGEMKVTSGIKQAPPKTEARDTIFFGSTDGTLSRRDPRQDDIENLPSIGREAK